MTVVALKDEPKTAQAILQCAICGKLAKAHDEVRKALFTAPSADATVTFLVKGSDGQVPRIVSDVTGWGEDTADDSFDLTAGTMTRENRSAPKVKNTRLRPSNNLGM